MLYLDELHQRKYSSNDLSKDLVAVTGRYVCPTNIFLIFSGPDYC